MTFFRKSKTNLADIYIRVVILANSSDGEIFFGFLLF